MPDKPCTRCKGSGKEPDALAAACDRLWSVINGDHSTHTLREAAGTLRAAALAEREQSEARIVFLEAALRDILSYARENGPGTATIFQVGHDKVRDWRAILDGKAAERHVFRDSAYLRTEDARARSPESTCPGGC